MPSTGYGMEFHNGVIAFRLQDPIYHQTLPHSWQHQTPASLLVELPCWCWDWYFASTTTLHLSSCSVAGAPGPPIPLSTVVRPSLRWSVNLTSSVSWQFLIWNDLHFSEQLQTAMFQKKVCNLTHNWWFHRCSTTSLISTTYFSCANIIAQ